MTTPVARRATETALALSLVAWRLFSRPFPASLTDFLLIAGLAWGLLVWTPERGRTAVTVAAALALFTSYAWRHLPMILDHLRLAL